MRGASWLVAVVGTAALCACLERVEPISDAAFVCRAPSHQILARWPEPETVQLEAGWLDSSQNFEPSSVETGWMVLDEFGGSVTGHGLYTTPWNHGGIARIEARAGPDVAVCELDVHLEIERVSDLDEPLAGRALDAAAEPVVDAACAPVVRYPLDAAVVPRNLPPPHLQWEPAPVQDLFVVTVEAPHATARFVSPAQEWIPDPGIWYALTHPDPEGELSITVAGGRSDGEDLVGGLCVDPRPILVQTGELGLQGTVYYWSPSTSGLWKLDVGAEQAEPWMSEQTTGYCVGCHSANLAAPDRMAMSYGLIGAWAIVADVDAPEEPVIQPGMVQGNFMTLSPDGQRLVRSLEGELFLHDVETSEELAQLPTVGHATHPDWSPDGDTIAYASCEYAEGGEDWRAHGCSVALIDVLGDAAFGPSRTVVPLDDSSYYYPVFSPDSAWLAFACAPDLPGDDNDSDDNPNAELMMVAVDGGEPLLLQAANGAPSEPNSFPRWGPSEGRTAWLAFGSRRDYGWMTDGIPQVWIAAVDLDRADAGLDPSSPPVWLPGQDVAFGNHSPVWVPRYSGP